MFVEIFKKDIFFKEYIKLFSIRTALSNLSIEYSKEDLTAPENAMKVENFLAAFEFLYANQNPEERIYPNTFHAVSSLVNKEEYFSNGYRKINVQSGMSFEPSLPKNIPNDVMNLLYNYYSVWNTLSPYEREARFFIGLVRIQPYENGNKRTMNIIMNFNLLAQQCAPVVIDKRYVSEYLRCIDECDYDAFSLLLEQLSLKEREVMVSLSRNMKSHSIEPEDEVKHNLA